MKPMKFGMGQSIRRVEDDPLVQGKGRYTSDLIPANALHGFVLRSPHAHATFTMKNVDAARAMKGVKLILTAADLTHLGNLPLVAVVPNGDGSTIVAPPWEILCTNTVRHVGEGVAFIVADSVSHAKDAAEAIEIEWKTLPVVTDAVSAAKPGAPLIWPDRPGNKAGSYFYGDEAKTKATFAKADKVVELTIINNRLVTNYMETRAAIGEYNAKTGYTLTLGSQGSHGIRAILANMILKVKMDQVRVITPDVGGGFGTKSFMFREYPLVLEAAKRLKKPVAWVSERTEHFFACSQGRDNVSLAKAALDKTGKILGLTVETEADMGAYLSQYSTFIPWVGAAMLSGVYAIPNIWAHINLRFTNTVPVDAYRGAGRPEAAYLLERLMDHIARETGLKPETVRRRNFIKPSAMPYKTPTGKVYDSGEFDGHMTKAMEIADWKGFPARLRTSKKAGLIRGIGMSTYIEACGGGMPENAWISLEEDGSVTVKVGTQSNGQGHATAYAQIVSQYLDIPLNRVKMIQGDTAQVPSGTGTGGSRSIPVGGAAVDTATRTFVDKLKELAATELETAPGDLDIADGKVIISGTDRSLDLASIAKLKGADGLKDVNGSWRPPEATYPNGTHSVELDIDPETGATMIRNYVIVDDFGVTLNPMMLAGQVHGGIAQGLGQALTERTVYDPDNGQLLTASFMDYAVPRAHDMPDLHFETRNVRCTTNLLGIKGAGEAGTIGATPAVMNAVADALFRAYGIRHIDMPATPHVIWQAIQKAKA